MRRRKGMGTALASFIVVGGLILGGAALAGTRGEKVEDIVAAVDWTNGTVTLGETTYRVTKETRLMDADERRIRLRDLAAGDNGDMVEVVLRRGRSGSSPAIRSLRILEGDFE